MGFLRCCVYYGILAVVSFFIGRLLPKSWFHGDKFPYRCASWEAKALPLSARARVAGQGARHEQDRPQAHPRQKTGHGLSRAASAHDRRDLRRRVHALCAHPARLFTHCASGPERAARSSPPSISYSAICRFSSFSATTGRGCKASRRAAAPEQTQPKKNNSKGSELFMKVLIFKLQHRRGAQLLRRGARGGVPQPKHSLRHRGRPALHLARGLALYLELARAHLPPRAGSFPRGLPRGGGSSRAVSRGFRALPLSDAGRGKSSAASLPAAGTTRSSAPHVRGADGQRGREDAPAEPQDLLHRHGLHLFAQREGQLARPLLYPCLVALGRFLSAAA